MTETAISDQELLETIRNPRFLPRSEREKLKQILASKGYLPESSRTPLAGFLDWNGPFLEIGRLWSDKRAMIVINDHSHSANLRSRDEIGDYLKTLTSRNPADYRMVYPGCLDFIPHRERPVTIFLSGVGDELRCELTVESIEHATSVASQLRVSKTIAALSRLNFCW